MIRAVDRVGSDSVKWHKYAGQDVIPLWIADTDFAADDNILHALQQRIEHGVLGYGCVTEAFCDAVVAYLARQYDWRIDPAWICPLPGVVPGLNIARAVTQARGKHAALTVSPTYPHLRKNPPILDFRQQFVEADDGGDAWTVDFAALAERIDDDTGLLLLCHPHNPLGKVYSEAELEAFAELARAKNLLVCSDEIHCDLILDGSRHRPFASLNDDALARSITLMAPSKTYNIAGLTCSFAVIADSALRQQFTSQCAGLCGDVNILGMAAATAAFNHGEAWRQAMIVALQDNAKLLYARINAMPYLRMKPVHATYLAWIDARALPVAQPQHFFEQAGVGLADGADYGWPGFVRLNFGCDQALLEQALKRMAEAVTRV